MKKALANKDILRLHDEWGIDSALQEKPRGYLKPQKPQVPTPSAPTKPTQLFSQVQTLNDKITDLRATISQTQTLEELKALMEKFDGCQLKKTATHTVFGEGVANPKIMVIGEAPGADEDLQGRPFVGKSGQLLANILASIGLSRQTNAYISNIIPWRPPGNRPPTSEEVGLCLPFIERHIELANPQALLIVGAVSMKALLGLDSGIMRHRGQWMNYTSAFEKKSFPVMLTYHPAYLLRSPGQKEKVWQDMLKLKVEFLDKIST